MEERLSLLTRGQHNPEQHSLSETGKCGSSLAKPFPEIIKLDSRQPLCLQYPPKGRGVRDCHRPCVSILITPRLPRGVVSETVTAPVSVFHHYYYCLDLAMINPYSSETGGFSFSYPLSSAWPRQYAECDRNGKLHLLNTPALARQTTAPK